LIFDAFEISYQWVVISEFEEFSFYYYFQSK